MKRLPLILVLIFIISTAFTGSKGVVHGVISNEKGQPLKGVGIKLKLGAHTLDYIYTDKKGHFTFENLEEGSYKVIVSGYFVGYKSRFFHNVDVETSKMLEMDMSLQPLKHKEMTIVRYGNNDLYADEYEDWSDISIRNKK